MIKLIITILLCLVVFIFVELYNYKQNFTGVRNQSYDIRGDPFPISKIPLSPWMMSTISPNYYYAPLTFTNSYDGWSNGGYLYNEYIPPYYYKQYKPFSLFVNDK